MQHLSASSETWRLGRRMQSYESNAAQGALFVFYAS